MTTQEIELFRQLIEKINRLERRIGLLDVMEGGNITSVNGATGAVVLDSDDIAEGVTNLWFTAAEETKLAGIEALADVTDAGNVGTSIDGATAKTTPVDADTMPLIDSAAANVLKKVTWANIKATIATYYNSLAATLTNKTLDSTNISTLTSKTTPIDADSFVAVDSAATDFLKRVTGTNLKAFLKTYFDTLFAVLAGTAGGQTLNGGTAANEDLTLSGTAHATKTTSYVILQPSGGKVAIGASTASELLHVTEGALRISRDSSTGPGYFEFEETQVGGLTGKFDINGGVMRFGERFVSNVFGVDLANKRVGITTMAPAGKLHVDQDSTTAAIPVLILDQADLSEEFIEFVGTVGAGNSIDTAAVGTYYGKIRVNVSGVGYKYIALYNT